MQMAGDLARAHAARIHRDDLLIEAGKAALIFRDQLRVKARLPVARDRQVNPARAGQSGHAGSPPLPSCPPTHEIADSPAETLQ
jgi:hypothetical protein